MGRIKFCSTGACWHVVKAMVCSRTDGKHIQKASANDDEAPALASAEVSVNKQKLVMMIMHTLRMAKL